jgi:indole-3-acetate monooxygenase
MSAADQHELVKMATVLASDLASRGHAIEQARAVPDDVMAQVASSGLLELLIPTEIGGAGGDWRTTLDVLQVLGRADASTAWTVMAGVSGNQVSGYLDRASATEVFGAGTVLTVGVYEPRGKAVAASADGSSGLVSLKGRWPFASGVQWSDWCCLGAISSVRGERQLRQFLVPRDLVSIIPNWDVMGLCGTGSHDVDVPDTVVADRSFMFADDPWTDDLLWRVPYFTVATSLMASVAVGVAEGAVVGGVFQNELARKGRMIDKDPCREAEFASAYGVIQAARAALDREVDNIWAYASAGDTPPLLDRAKLWLASIQGVHSCDDALSALFTSSGGSVVRADRPLQRAMRDVKAIGQHVLMSRRQLTPIGLALTGRDPDCEPFL